MMSRTPEGFDSMIGSATRLRVLHILGPLRPSGMERMLVSGSQYFADEGVDGTIYGLLEGSTFAAELRTAGYEVVLGERIASSLQAAQFFRELVRDGRFDVIHIHTEADYLRTVAVVRWSVGFRHVAIVRTVHSTFLASGRWRLSRMVQAAVGDKLVGSVVAPTPDIALVEHGIGRRCEVIYNWVDDRFFELRKRRIFERKKRAVVSTSSGPDALVAIIVGNCSNIKRHELALRAARDVGLQIVHIGDEQGASRDERLLLDELERAGKLLSRGVRAPDQSLVDADVFLMPSRHEGMSIALAEAITVGLPALVSDAPGFRWADEIPGVRLLSDSQANWRDALRASQDSNLKSQQVGQPSVDLSAKRGVGEYSALYRRLVVRA